jgi:hypothetical protein
MQNYHFTPFFSSTFFLIFYPFLLFSLFLSLVPFSFPPTPLAPSPLPTHNHDNTQPQIKLEPYLAPLTPLSTHLSSPISPTSANSPSTIASTTYNNTSFLYLLSLHLSRNSFSSTTLLLFHLSTLYSIMSTLSRN